MNLKELYKNTPDCGDNSCVFATKKGGMRTNGGCHCFPREMRLEDRRFFTLLFQATKSFVEVEYIESGSFQGGEEAVFLAGIKHGSTNYVIKGEKK